MSRLLLVLSVALLAGCPSAEGPRGGRGEEEPEAAPAVVEPELSAPQKIDRAVALLTSNSPTDTATAISLLRTTASYAAFGVAGILSVAAMVGAAGLYGVWAELCDPDNRLALGVVSVVSIMHFWYDGFIWSVAKRQI